MYFHVIKFRYSFVRKAGRDVSSQGLAGKDFAQTYLQLPLRQWGAGNVHLLVLSSWKVNIAENPIDVMGL